MRANEARCFKGKELLWQLLGDALYIQFQFTMKLRAGGSCGDLGASHRRQMCPARACERIRFRGVLCRKQRVFLSAIVVIANPVTIIPT